MLKEETIRRALKEIAKGEAQRRYFFERANSPGWLKPLADAGYFQQPPAPATHGEYISFPTWEQSQYLARMAKFAPAQNLVAEIADRIPETDNVRVHDDLLDIALAVPADLATRFVPRVIIWLKSPYKLGFPDKLCDFIPHLANGGQSEAALDVARQALAPQPDPRWEERKDNEFYTPAPQSRFADYHYRNIVDRAISPLVRVAGAKAVTLLADLLESAIMLMRKPGHEGAEDYLWISQEDLNAGPRFDRVPNVLLCATRRAAEQAIKLQPKSFEAIVADFKSREWSAFRRLILHLCAVFPDLSTTESALQLANSEVLEWPSTQFEAKALLSVSFGRIPPEVQDSILQRIERGPDRDSVAIWLGESATPQQIDDYYNRWRRDRLALIEGSLPANWQERLKEQIASLGQPNPLRPAVRFSGGFIGPRSPIAPDSLLLLSPEQVIEYVRNWRPNSGLFEASIEGLGKTLTQVVAKRPDEYSAVAEGFKRVDPTYVRAYFQGLLEDRKRKVGFAWAPVLELAAWVVSQPREIPGRTGGLMDRDPDWGWTRKAILDLFEESLGDDSECFQPEHREKIWRVLHPLTDDPDPTPQHEVEYGGSNMDPATMAINTVRGDAFNCLVSFAGWVRGGIEKSSPEAEWPPRSFDIVPEVRDVLDSHLDVAIEPSLTIRSVYGRWLPFIASLDWDWTVTSLPRIFPQAATDLPRLQAVWESFVVFNSPNPALLPLLLPYYRSAIDRLSKVPSLMKHPSAPEDCLAEHLAAYYWYDKVQIHEDGGLLPQFFRSATPNVRGHLIWFVGSCASGWENDVPSLVFERLRSLFEWRVQVAREADSPSEFTAELSRFGLWFTSKRFGDPWSLSMVQTVLDLVGDIDMDMSVGERLVELAPQFPLECVRALTTMVTRAKESWLIMSIQESAKQVIRIATGSGNPDAVFTARKLAEELISRQHFAFRDVL